MGHITEKKTIAIVGGGAGGIFAALGAAAAAKGACRILLIERNPRLGIKILISGGGKCNITHIGEPESVLKEGFPYENERRFLKPALYRYKSEQVLALLEKHGVSWHARENGRVFPDSSRAEDVLIAFERELEECGVELMTNARVSSIEPQEGQWKILIGKTSIQADSLILATGGVSYKKVGTTGDGITFAEQLGHTVIRLRAALAPIYLKEIPPKELQGVAIRDAELLVRSNDRIIGKAVGDVLITHRGLSGPPVLGISRSAAHAGEESEIEILVNLLDRPEEKVRTLLVGLQQERTGQQVKTWLEEALPNRMVPWLLSKANIPEDRRWSALTREERSRLLECLVRFPFGPVLDIPIDRGEVTAGGVNLKEVDPKTMMSRKHSGLFFAGEMLDISGEIGGFNLQAAYSTGWVAGEEAARKVLGTGELGLRTGD